MPFMPQEHDRHADDDAGGDVHLKKAREHDADTAHLSSDVGEGHEQRAHHRHQPRGIAVVAVADEVGHGELAELAQVGRQQQGQQHVATGPAEQIHRAVVAHEGNQPGHGDERGRAHPVGGSSHAVGYRMHAAAGDVELLGGTDPRPDRDADVQGEGQPNDDVGPGLH
jgi:hypothetical protein